MNRRFPVRLWRRLQSVAAALKITPWECVVMALTRYLGMEGVPLEDETVWADEQQKGRDE